MKVGDLVKVVASNAPFRFRPDRDSIGIIVEIKEYNWVGTCYFVLINDIGWRYTEEEIEVINDGSG
jgi:hypothetical protein